MPPLEQILAKHQAERDAEQKRPSKAKGWRKPPTPKHRHSVKNSHTAPKKIVRKQRIDEALQYRLAGASFPQIAKQMRISISTAHGYVAEGMEAIPLENAKLVLAQELARLDALLNAHIHNAGKGEISSTRIVLDIMHHRARLLGLYPETGRQQVLIGASAGPGVKSSIEVTFVMPTGRREGDRPPPGFSGAPLALPPPKDQPFDMWQDPTTGRWRSSPTE
jgi:hypothetical protein